MAEKLGLALSGGGHRAAFFHIGVLARLAETGLLRLVEVISTVSGGSIVGALYYLKVMDLLETKTDDEISDADYVKLVRELEAEYRSAAATNVRGSAWSSLIANVKMAIKPTYSRTDRVAELYEKRFYRKAWGDRTLRNGRIAMRDLRIAPKGHEGGFDPDTDNATRTARVPILLLESTTMNTGHNWRFEAMYMGEPPRQGTPDSAGPDLEAIHRDIDKNAVLSRTRWEDLPESCRDLPLGSAVVSSACFPGGFPPMQIPRLLPDFVIELIDGGVHDNQGVEGLVDRHCTLMIISDGSGQMPDVKRPSTRLPAVLGRVLSIYSDAEREQRLFDALEHETCAFMHLQTGIPAVTRPLSSAHKAEEQDVPMATTAFGVDLRVQRALAEVRTDLDAFCDTEAWALMADGYKLASKILPSRPRIATLGKMDAPGGEWAFTVVGDQLASGNEDFLKVLHVAKERFLKPARMVRGGLAVANALIALIAVAAGAGLWLLLTPHGTALFIVLLALAVAGGIYFMSDKPYIGRVAVVVFDIIVPALLAIPLLGIAALQLSAGQLWRRLGRVTAPKKMKGAVPAREM